MSCMCRGPCINCMCRMPCMSCMCGRRCVLCMQSALCELYVQRVIWMCRGRCMNCSMCVACVVPGMCRGRNMCFTCRGRCMSCVCKGRGMCCMFTVRCMYCICWRLASVLPIVCQLFTYSESPSTPIDDGLSRSHSARVGWCSQDVLAQLSKLEPEDPRRPAAVDLVTSNFDKFGDNGEVRLDSSHPIRFHTVHCAW